MTTPVPALPTIRIWGREPAQWVHLLSGLLIFLTPVLHLSVDLSGAIMAVIAALSGLVTAVSVSKDQAAPLVAGLIKALLALALALHFHLSVDVQSGIMVAVEGAVAFFLRTQLTAPVDPSGNPQ